MEPNRVSVSDIVGYSRCRYALGIRSRNGLNLHPALPAPALFIGVAGHHTMGWCWLKEKQTDGYIVSADEIQDKAREITEHMLSEVETHIDNVRMNEYLMTAIDNLVAAVKYWPRWFRERDSENDFVTVDVETPIRIDITDNLMLSGRLDRLLMHRGSGRLFINDLKTAAVIRSGDEQYRVQFVLYGLMGYKLYGDRFGGFVTDYVKKTPPTTPKLTHSGLSKNKRASIHHYAYFDAIIENQLDPVYYAEYLKHLRDTQTPKYFKRVITHWPNVMFDRVYARVRRQVQEVFDYCQAFAHDMDSVVWFDQNPVTCKGCGFREPCLMSQRGVDVDRFLRAIYTDAEVIPDLEAYL